ncbi:MAG: alpha-galactosidase [Ruminococcaceae bacterium]|nr:alpha-galactosidase [Oscillospiraceae bacterium]
MTTQKEKIRAINTFLNYIGNLSDFPISFKIGDKEYKGLDEDFTLIKKETSECGNKNKILLVLSHVSGLELTLDCAYYPDYAAFEWTGFFTNISEKDSPVLSEVNAADITFTGENAVLIGLVGDAVNPNLGTDDGQVMNNQPYTTVLPEGITKFASFDGRPTDTCFPYYDFQYAEGGALIAVGWQGQWRSSFDKKNDTVIFTAGQETFSSYLKAGETMRMPLIAMVLYDGRDEERSVNIWRRWFIDCNMRKVRGQLLQPALAAFTGRPCMTLTNEDAELRNISVYEKMGINLDYWWMDAGWYFIDSEGSSCREIEDYANTGVWIVDTNRFPTKLKVISDKMKSIGGGTILWFEPERFGLKLEDLKDDSSTLRKEWILPYDDRWGFVNYGNPEALKWISDRVFSILETADITIYREDFNVPPLRAWTAGDTEDRRGMTENLYIQGHLHFWDSLIERFPDMMIDSCASGGRRNDLESMRRAVPLHYSDFYRFDPAKISGVCQMLYKWFPYLKNYGTTATLVEDPDKYLMLNTFSPMLLLSINPEADKTADVEFLQKYQKWHRELGEYFYSDYYVLTPWTVSDKDWIGYMFINDENGMGFVQISRHVNNADSKKVIKLKGLDENTSYRLTDFNNNFGGIFTGRVLMEEGLEVIMPAAGSATIIRIEKIQIED